MGKTLLAGPWVGEFGWELFSWQAHVRFMSKYYNKTVVVGRPGNQFLYSDFCNEYVEFDPKCVSSGVDNCTGGVPFDKSIIKDIKFEDWIPGKRQPGASFKPFFKVRPEFLAKQKFIKFESNTLDKTFDILIHARNKKDKRDWSLKNWSNLVESLKGFKIGSIGTSSGAFHIKGTEDVRNINLSDLVSIINRTNLVAGPSSGPLHLASLCGTNHLVWSDFTNKERYLNFWNPLKTKCTFFDEFGWNPDPRNIEIKIRNEFLFF